jgi:hypothetical protein
MKKYICCPRKNLNEKDCLGSARVSVHMSPLFLSEDEKAPSRNPVFQNRISKVKPLFLKHWKNLKMKSI